MESHNNVWQLQVTLEGDLSAILAAVFFCGYIIIGAPLRKCLPIFLDATPVTSLLRNSSRVSQHPTPPRSPEDYFKGLAPTVLRNLVRPFWLLERI